MSSGIARRIVAFFYAAGICVIYSQCLEEEQFSAAVRMLMTNVVLASSLLRTQVTRSRSYL